MDYIRAKNKIKRTIYSSKSLQQLQTGVTYSNLLLKTLSYSAMISLQDFLTFHHRIKRNQLLRELNRTILQ